MLLYISAFVLPIRFHDYDFWGRRLFSVLLNTHCPSHSFKASKSVAEWLLTGHVLQHNVVAASYWNDSVICPRGLWSPLAWFLFTSKPVFLTNRLNFNFVYGRRYRYFVRYLYSTTVRNFQLQYFFKKNTALKCFTFEHLGNILIGWLPERISVPH